MANKNLTGIIIVLFVGLIITVVFIQSIGNTVQEVTNKVDATNEEREFVNDGSTTDFWNTTGVNASQNATFRSQAVWKQTKCVIEDLIVSNGSTIYVSATHYDADLALGIINWIEVGCGDDCINHTATNTTIMNYTYCNDNYVADSSSRTFTNLIVLMAAIAILVFAVVVIFPLMSNRKGA